MIKRVFPLIIFLITLSMLGLIFFQFLWLQKAYAFKNETLEELLYKISNDAANTLVEGKKLASQPNKPETLLPITGISPEFQKRSIIQSYSLQEIGRILQAQFDARGLGNIPYEYSVTENSLTGSEVYTPNFHKYFLDTLNSINYTTILEAESGSNLENLTNKEFLVIVIPHQRSIIIKEIAWFIVGAVLFTLIIIMAFYLTVRTILKQKKLSEIKNDFINNMTHEFKTPLATISLAVDALKNEKVIGDREKSAYFSGIIKEENIRMNKQVETILQAALLDKHEIDMQVEPLSAHALIQKAINNIQLPLQEKNGSLQVKLDAAKDTISGNEVHFTNIINNLLDNALKYSKENPQIKLSTLSTDKYLKIKIEDDGIGMNRDTLNRIFEKFYRAHTGNVHNVKGFGLGLSYVQKMVKAHKGTIKAESTLGKGSCFFIQIPLEVA